MSSNTETAKAMERLTDRRKLTPREHITNTLITLTVQADLTGWDKDMEIPTEFLQPMTYEFNPMVETTIGILDPQTINQMDLRGLEPGVPRDPLVQLTLQDTLGQPDPINVLGLQDLSDSKSQLDPMGPQDPRGPFLL